MSGSRTHEQIAKAQKNKKRRAAPPQKLEPSYSSRITAQAIDRILRAPDPDSVLQLQSTIGNRATQQLLAQSQTARVAPNSIQRKGLKKKIKRLGKKIFSKKRKKGDDDEEETIDGATSQDVVESIDEEAEQGVPEAIEEQLLAMHCRERKRGGWADWNNNVITEAMIRDFQEAGGLQAVKRLKLEWEGGNWVPPIAHRDWDLKSENVGKRIEKDKQRKEWVGGKQQKTYVGQMMTYGGSVITQDSTLHSFAQLVNEQLKPQKLNKDLHLSSESGFAHDWGGNIVRPQVYSLMKTLGGQELMNQGRFFQGSDDFASSMITNLGDHRSLDDMMDAMAKQHPALVATAEKAKSLQLTYSWEQKAFLDWGGNVVENNDIREFSERFPWKKLKEFGAKVEDGYWLLEANDECERERDIHPASFQELFAELIRSNRVLNGMSRFDDDDDDEDDDHDDGRVKVYANTDDEDTNDADPYNDVDPEQMQQALRLRGRPNYSAIIGGKEMDGLEIDKWLTEREQKQAKKSEQKSSPSTEDKFEGVSDDEMKQARYVRGKPNYSAWIDGKEMDGLEIDQWMKEKEAKKSENNDRNDGKKKKKLGGSSESGIEGVTDDELKSARYVRGKPNYSAWIGGKELDGLEIDQWLTEQEEKAKQEKDKLEEENLA